MDVFSRAEDGARNLAALSGKSSHDVVVICGSGLAGLGLQLDSNAMAIPLGDLLLPTPAVHGHGSDAYSASVAGKNVLILSGRVHLYEGLDVSEVVAGVRLGACAGAKILITTNAVGGADPSLDIGTPVIISDHINLTGANPLTGLGAEPYGKTRFVGMSEAYSKRLRGIARGASGDVVEGVLAALPGPSYETPAEISMLRTLGASVVGMSVVCETIAARHMGMEVLGVSLVTNKAAGLGDEPRHEDVAAASALSTDSMLGLLSHVIRSC